MKIISQSHEIMDNLDGKEILKKIELCGRVCYKSEDKITDNSAEKFVANIIKRGHESVLEHVSFTVRFITDRSVTHELVRHRLCAYSQESQRYVKYHNMEFIMPVGMTEDELTDWRYAMDSAESRYLSLLAANLSPQMARAVLPNSTKTEIVVSANIREWRHILKLRTSPAAHPQIRSLMCGLLAELKAKVPGVFDDIGGTENED
jgi:thymidylate synthase (FAD)